MEKEWWAKGVLGNSDNWMYFGNGASGICQFDTEAGTKRGIRMMPEQLRWGTGREEWVQKEIEIPVLSSHCGEHFKQASANLSLELKRDGKAAGVSIAGYTGPHHLVSRSCSPAHSCASHWTVSPLRAGRGLIIVIPPGLWGRSHSINSSGMNKGINIDFIYPFKSVC